MEYNNDEELKNIVLKLEDDILMIKQKKNFYNDKFEQIALTQAYVNITNAKMWLNKIVYDDL